MVKILKCKTIWIQYMDKIQRNILPKLLKYYKPRESRNRRKTFEETAGQTGPEWPNKLSNCFLLLYCLFL